MNQQEKEIKADINECLKKDYSIKEVVDRICTIPGVGILTAATILGETNGFELIRNKKQLTSYAGLDIKEKQSGTSIKGKSRISKKGNRHLRKAMHLPALTAIRHDEHYKELFARLVSRHGIKMKAAVAVQRKLLELTYILFINQTMYDAEKLNLNEKEQQLQ
jgi:transposase